MIDFDLTYITIPVLAFSLLFFIIQNIRLSANNRALEFDLKIRDCDISELKSKLDDRSKTTTSKEILQILSELNSGGSLLKIERVDQNNLFQWHPTDRTQS